MQLGLDQARGNVHDANPPVAGGGQLDAARKGPEVAQHLPEARVAAKLHRGANRGHEEEDKAKPRRDRKAKPITQLE